MKILVYLALLLAVVSAIKKVRRQHHFLELSNFQYDGEVVVLTAQNFDSAVHHFEVMLIDFYAPWCPHCQRLEPEFAKAAKQLKSHGIVLGKVDCTTQNELRERFDVRGFPTLRIFYHDKIYHYHGHRHAESIVEYMLEHLREEKDKQNN